MVFRYTSNIYVTAMNHPFAQRGGETMPEKFPEYLSGMVSSSKDAICDLLHNPALWSQQMAKRTLERSGGQAFNIQDVQSIIKDYVTVLSETIRRGDPL